MQVQLVALYLSSSVAIQVLRCLYFIQLMFHMKCIMSIDCFTYSV